jgi:hypothetical protein
MAVLRTDLWACKMVEFVFIGCELCLFVDSNLDLKVWDEHFVGAGYTAGGIATADGLRGEF